MIESLRELSLPRMLLVALGGAVIPLSCHAGGPPALSDSKVLRLEGRDEEGVRARSRLRLEPRSDGGFDVTRRERDETGRERMFTGTGYRKGERLVVELRSAAAARPLTLTGVYMVSPDRLLGVVQTPSWKGATSAPIWTEESGPRPERLPWAGEAASAPPGRVAPAVSAPPTPTATPTPTPPPVAGSGIERDLSGPADTRLAAIQRLAVAVARVELERGVREDPPGSNRGERIDLYARTAGMPVAGAWCGYFVGYCYSEAARQQGKRFSGQRVLHSVGKVRSYFNYRDYTRRATASAVATHESNRSEQARQGSPRRYFTPSGSYGDRWAARQGLPHQTYDDPLLLPIRAGDTVIFLRASQGTKVRSARGHLGLVESYTGGVLTTIEGNTGHRVRRKTYDLRDRSVLLRIDGFGRPALGDFE